MTNYLVPSFILEKYAKNEYNGRFPATALFVDISGFSAITDQLMAHGQHGAEILAGVMGAIFEPLINAVYSQGGFVSGFAGDAFTAVFPHSRSDNHQALAAAVAIQEQMQARPNQETPYGRFDMSAKVGLAVGEVVWGIVSSEDGRQASYYFQGSAIDDSAAAEHAADPGEVILDAACYSAVQESLTAEASGDFYKLSQVTAALPAPRPPVQPEFDPDKLLCFVPEAAIRAGRTGEFRQVVNLFISLPTVRTDAQLDIFMKTVFELAKRYGGFLKQLDYGDKGANLLLFWGAPVAHENDVQRALHFILDLQTQTAIPINGGLTYHVAHAGYIGSSLRGEYTCYGRGVNLAARFMTSAPRGEIWLDEQIARRAGVQFDIEYEGQKPFKGFAEPQKVYILFERKDSVDNLYDDRIVGRELELTRLAEFVTPIFRSQGGGMGHSPGMLVVWGEPGAGKSHLVHEFLSHHLHPEAQTQIFLAQSDEILRQSLNPFRYWLKRYFSLSEGLAEARNKRSFNRKMDNLIGQTEDAALADELDRVRSFLGALVGLHWSDSLYEQQEAKARQENTLSALTALLKAESRLRPVILLLEDAHWMDKDSAEYLIKLLEELGRVESYPLAILATARYEGHGLPLEGFSYEELNLSRLTRTDLGALAHSFLGNPPAENLLDLLVDQAEGNPFFAEQLLRYLKEAEQLTLVDGEWRAIVQERSPLPGDVNALLVSRLDRLAHQVREVVQTAAVLGREFEARLLSRMLLDQPDLSGMIAQAEAEAIWSAVNEIRYIFRHALLRDAAYRMQLHARRLALHKLALEALESLYKADLSGQYVALAYHAELAGIAQKAFGYYLAAADVAMQTFSIPETITHFSKAIPLLSQVKSTPSERQQMCLQYGRALELSGQFPAAMSHYQNMEALASRIHDQPLELAALVAQGTLRSTGNIMVNFALGESLGHQAFELAQALNDEAAKAKILWNLLNVYRQTDRNEKAFEAGQRSYALAESLNLREQTAYTANDLMKIHLLLGQMSKMEPYGRRAIAIWRELDNPPMLADTLITLGSAYGYHGRFDLALPMYEEAMEICRKLNNAWGQAFAYFIPVVINLAQLNIEPALADSAASIELGEKSGSTVAMIYMYMFQALLMMVSSDYRQATEIADFTLELVESTLVNIKDQARGLLAIIYYHSGDITLADNLVESIGVTPETAVLTMLLMPEKALARHLLYHQDYEGLAILSSKMIGEIEAYESFILNLAFYYFHGQALLGLNDPDGAKRTLQRGLELFRKLAIRWGYPETAELLAEIEEQAGNLAEAAELRAEVAGMIRVL